MTAAKTPPERLTLYWCDSYFGIHVQSGGGTWNGERLVPAEFVLASVVEKRERALMEALATCRSALRAVASCRVCGDGTQVGFQQHHEGCWPDEDLPQVDLDEVVQAAWETASAALAAADEREAKP